jgi:hypothetical protein
MGSCVAGALTFARLLPSGFRVSFCDAIACVFCVLRPGEKSQLANGHSAGISRADDLQRGQRVSRTLDKNMSRISAFATSSWVGCD